MYPCPAGCVLSFGRKSSSSNRSSRRVLCLIVQTIVQKLVENYCFSRVSDDTLGSFWARFWRRSLLQGHCVSLSGRVRFQPREEEQHDFGAVPSFRATVFPCPAGCVFSFGRKSSSSNRSSRRVLCLICFIVQPVNWSKTIVFLGFQKGR